MEEMEKDWLGLREILEKMEYLELQESVDFLEQLEFVTCLHVFLHTALGMTLLEKDQTSKSGKE